MRILYHLPLSPYSRKVRLALAEKRITFELRVEKVWERRSEFLELNPAGTVPVLVEENGLVIADSYAITEYLDEAYPDIALLGRTLAERAEVRRLLSWFDNLFGQEVSRNLIWERHLKRQLGHGSPDGAVIRAGYANLKSHLDEIGFLAERHTWLAGPHITMADFAAAGHLSALDYANDVDWSHNQAARDWYSRMKSRPCFRNVLADRISGLEPPAHYTDLDF